MLRIRGNRQAQIRQIGVDEKVVVARMRLADAGGDDAHAFDAELDTDWISHRLAIPGRYEKYRSALRRSAS